MTHAYMYFLSLLAARTIVVFFAVILGLRLMGKREMGQMHVYDLALIMALSNAVQNAMTNGDGDLTIGLVCGGTLLILGRVTTALFLKLPKLEQGLGGSPSILVNEGKMIESHMRKEGVCEDELIAALREHGLTEVREARMAVIEADGTLSIVPFSWPTETEAAGP